MILANQDFYEDYIYSCNKCKSCTQTDPGLMAACPPFEKMKFFNYCGGGKAHIAQGIIDETVENLSELAEYFYMCTQCGACSHNCPIGIDHAFLIWDVRRLLNKNSCAPAALAPVMDSIVKNNNPFGFPAADKGQWLIEQGVKDIRKEAAQYLYFAGCASAFRQAAAPAARAAVALLDKAGIDFGVLGSDEPCCGLQACELGDYKLFKQTAKRTMETFESARIEKIVVSDPHCYDCFVNSYPEVVDESPPVVFITDLLAGLLDSGKLKLGKKLAGKVGYHDPCRLARKTEITESPRKLLAAICTQPLIELPRNRKSTYCCGNAPGISAAYPELMEHAAGRRMAEAAACGVEKLVTACPYCGNSLGRASESSDENPLTADLLELLAKSVE